MKKWKIIRYAVGFFASLFLLVSLLIGSIELGAFGRLSFFRNQYEKLEVAKDVDMEIDDLMDLTREMLSYLKGGRDDLDIVTTIGGKQMEFFNQREKDHMVDVRNLNINARNVGIVLFILSVGMYLGIYFYSKAEYKKLRPAIDGGVMPLIPSKLFLWFFSVTLLVGVVVFFMILGLGALIVSSNFDRYWRMFHKIFFTNDLWLLDPATDRLINIVPEEFFSALVARCAIIYVVILTILLIFAVRKSIAVHREMNKGKRRFHLKAEDKIAGMFAAFLLGGCLAYAPVQVHAEETSAEYDAVEQMIASIPTADPWPEAPQITAKHAILVEVGSGRVIFAKDALGSAYPASTTKILTAYLAFNFAASNEASDILTYSRAAVVSLPAGASHIGLKVGEQLSFEDSLYGLLLPSANEVANGLAEYVSGSNGDFVKKMNEAAARLGAVNSFFRNPSGLHDDKHTTCAYDLARIFMGCLAQPKFIEVSSRPTYIIPTTNLTDETRPVKNTHRMLHKTDKYYDPRVICGKTGTTPEAGGCLITYAKDGDLSYICVVMGAEAPNQYEDTKKLLDYGFEHFQKVNIAANDSRFYEGLESTDILTGATQLHFYQFDAHASLLVPHGVSFANLRTNVVRSITTNYSKIQYYLEDYLLGEAEILDATLSIRDYQSQITNLNAGSFPYQNLPPMVQKGRIQKQYIGWIIGGVVLLFVIGWCIYISRANVRRRKRHTLSTGRDIRFPKHGPKR